MTETMAQGKMPTSAGWGWLLAYGILSLALAVMAFIWPFSATIAATLIVGTFFMAAGLVSIGAGIFGGVRDGRGYAIAFGLVSLIIGAIMAFEPMTGALSLTLLVVFWLGVRGLLELVWGIRMSAHRGWMIALGLVNLLLALLVLATISWSAMTLPGYILGLSFLIAGIVEIARARAHRAHAQTF
ncbi:HdeD family acid-resistance protein [Hephaestia sp. GCM10023244]|uniref:HdeD family acid-resistance protein n=1 Tax=unclassified Hephaestia TaxID=2631281 RepID=UPI00207702C7|nr:DUF308 domain-containing protein [Hephaestia sp. MAHUQ-44]MCM8730654.1 DUF308 domain-containing protein [Hephaestia sp. MAHUQ-44]